MYAPAGLTSLGSSGRVAELGTVDNDGTSATGGSARSQADAIDARRWRPRRGLSFAISALTFLVPFACATLVVQFVTRMFGRPTTFLPFVVWLALLLVIATLTLRIVDRYARRLLPLATMLRLSLVFPDRAPSRFAIALKSGTGRALERAVEGTEAEAQFGTPQETAEAVVALIGRVGRHDRLTRGHCERVRAYADLIGQQLGLDADAAAKLHWAGLLHDVGKLDVDPAILNKKGRLTPEEWEHVKLHPARSDRWLGGLTPWLGEWALAASQHHERFDGHGYPYGLKGTKISLAGRIVAVADAFDVMTAARSYKKPFPAAQARVELTDNAGTQFDPTVVRAFLEISVGELKKVMGPVAWLAAVPELLRATVTGALEPARTAIVAASVAAAGLVPAIATPVRLVTPSSDVASGIANGLADSDGDGTPDANDVAPHSAEISTPIVPADPVTAPPDTTTTAAPAPTTAAPRSVPPAPPATHPPATSPPATAPPATTPTTVKVTTTTAAPTTTTTVRHPPIANDDPGTGPAIRLTVGSGGWTVVNVLKNDTDPDNNLKRSTLTVIGQSASNLETRVKQSGANYVVEVRANSLVIGSSWFDYRVCDTTNLCDTARASLVLISL
jgi:hypothetical protein